ncbi:MAG TPA: PQQ-dependent sugar dehydrogenase [Anaerolineae bacterium]
MRKLSRREMLMLMGVSTIGAELAAKDANALAESLLSNQDTDPSALHTDSADRRPESTVPAGFEVETIANVFDLPTAFAFLPDGRILAAEKAGMLKMIENGVVRAEPVIDLRGQVNDYVDRGFIDVAVDPNFTRNHYLYLLFTYRLPDMPHDSPKPVKGHLVRYVLDGNTIRPSSAKILLDDFESVLENHSVDSMRWTPQGTMFVSFGDGAVEIATSDVALRALDVDNLAGKIIRIDPETGDGVPGNPFYDALHPHTARSRVWAYGLRNPFRFAVHPVTGIPYIGNVGDVTYEMLNRALPGQNFAWPCVEGLIDRPDFQVKPACQNVNVGTAAQADYLYPHMGANACIIGGDFNFGTNFPAEMYGNYFMADYSLQWMKRAALGADGQLVRVDDFAASMGEPVDMKFGPDGFLYYMSIYSGGFRRISYKSGNHVPDAKLSATPVAGPAPLSVTFSSAGTTDPDGDAMTYHWDFGDGSQSHEPDAQHTYPVAGQYIVRLAVTDVKGGRRVTETLVTVGDAAPVVSITSPGNYSVYLPGQQVNLTANATDLLGNVLPATQTNWRITLHEDA